MHFSCPRETLHQGLQTVQKAVSTKTTLPILTGILLEAGENRLRLLATDLELGIECFIPVQTKQEGAIVLEGRYLTEIIRRLPEEEVEVTVDEEKKMAEIRCAKSVFRVHAMPAEDFPSLPENEGDLLLRIELPVFRQMVKETSFAVALDDTRPFLTGVLLELAENVVRMVATDTSRLALRQIAAGETYQPVQALVPTKALLEASRQVSSAEEEEVEITLGRKNITFEMDGVKIVSRLIEGQFPSYQQVIPKQSQTKVQAQRLPFLQAAERASLLGREGTSVVKMQISGDRMILSANVPEVGQAHEEVAIAKEGEDLEIAFNARFLIDVLRTLEAPEVLLELTGVHSPGLVKPVSEEDYTYVIMPVMVR